jgi:hypothetical protein
MINKSSFFVLLVLPITKATEVPRTKPNLFDPILSSNSYTGRIRENERVVQVEPSLYASDPDPPNSPNGLLIFNEIFFLY